MSNSTLNPTRQMLIDKYIEALERDEIPFEYGWYSYDTPQNAITGREYSGVNAMLLSYVAYDMQLEGNRWCTFNQIADKDGKYHPNEKWHLKKGSQSIPVEYWYVYNITEKKKYSIQEYNKAIKEGNYTDADFIWRVKTFNVFHESCIEGIQPPEKYRPEVQIDRLDVIDKLIVNLNVKYEEKGDKAYYSPILDKVVIPPYNHFKSEYDYCSTQLHELCHATGHNSRLNRNISNEFGSEEYAREEMRAEISSSMLSAELGIPVSEVNTENHLSYVQSWIAVLKSDPNELFRAIKDADEIIDYVEAKAEINKNVVEHNLNNDDYEIEM